MNIKCNNDNCPNKQTCSLYEKVTVRTKGNFVKHHHREYDGKCEFYKNKNRQQES